MKLYENNVGCGETVEVNQTKVDKSFRFSPQNLFSAWALNHVEFCRVCFKGSGRRSDCPSFRPGGSWPSYCTSWSQLKIRTVGTSDFLIFRPSSSLAS